MIVIANVFLKLETFKTWLGHSLKSAFLKNPLAINMLGSPKHLGNLHGSPFVIFFDYSEQK